MNQPNYYCVIPAEVRYSKKISLLAKLLYGEITALTNKDGYCYATNSYFAELYGKTETQISLTLKQLEENGFITIEIDQQNGNLRKIFLTTPIKENLKTSLRKLKDPSLKKLKDPTTNITRDNNINNNNKEKENNIKEKESEDMLSLKSDKFKEVFDQYLEMRKKIKKPMTAYAMRLALLKLEKLAPNDEERQIKILEQSIINSWQGLFDLKEGGYNYAKSISNLGNTDRAKLEEKYAKFE